MSLELSSGELGRIVDDALVDDALVGDEDEPSVSEYV